MCDTAIVLPEFLRSQVIGIYGKFVLMAERTVREPYSKYIIHEQDLLRPGVQGQDALERCIRPLS